MLDVVGGLGFLAKTSNHLGLCGFVRDTKIVARFNVTKPFVLTSIRQDVPATTYLRVPPKLFPPVPPLSTCFSVLAPCDSWLWNVPRKQTLAERIFVFWNHHAGSERYFWLGLWTTEICTVLLANVVEQLNVAVFEDKNMSSRTPDDSREHILCVKWKIIHSNASEDFAMEVTVLALACGSESLVDAVCAAVVGSVRTGRVFDAGFAREDESSNV